MPPHVPEDCDRLFAEHLNAGRLDDLLALYEPDATLVDPGGAPASGHAAIRKALSGLVAARSRIRMNVVKVVRGGGDLALLHNHWSMEAVGPEGKPTTATGKAIELVRRQPDGTWRFVIDDPMGGGA